jgi:hypothetical protein
VSAAKDAAAALAPAMAATLVEAMPLAGDDQLAADLAAQGVVAAPATVSSSAPQTATAAAPAPATEPAEIDEFDLDLDPTVPDDLQQLLDEPDFDEEVAAEVDAELDDGEIDYSTDPEVAKRLRTLEKRNAWLEEQRVNSEKKKWVAENLKAYPLLARYAADEVAAIAATSRRGFARQAAALNGRMAKMVQPALQEIADARKQLRGEVVQEVRSEYREGWGEITTGPSVSPVEAAAEQQEYDAAMKTGNLSKVIGVLMRSAGVNNDNR